MTIKIALVFGAGIWGYRDCARPDRESLYIIQAALSIPGCKLISLPGWSKKHEVHFGQLLTQRMEEGKFGSEVLHPEKEDYTDVNHFNTQGEVDAFWRYIEKHFPDQRIEVFAVARWVHSYRACYLLRTSRPEKFARVKIHRVGVKSREWTLPFHELGAWTKLLLTRVVSW